MINIENNTRYLNKNREYIEPYNDGMKMPDKRVRVVDNGIVLPKSELYLAKGGVTDGSGTFIPESSIQNEGSYIRIDGGYEFDETDESMSDTEVIYLGYFFRHWGHFLMDCTTRMWILLDDTYRDCKVVFPDHPANVRDGNYDRFLQLLGVEEDRIVKISGPTRFKKVIIPAEARISSNKMHTDEWYRIFDRVVENARYDIEKIPKRVYFSRGKFGKPELGESEIEHNYEINGFEIVYPERLTLDEQIGIFQNAEEVVSQNSSICMNVVFAKEGLKWTVINKYSTVHRNFSELRYCKNLDITFIDAFSPRLDFYGHKIGSLPYLMSFNDNMKAYFSDNGMKYETFGPWYRFCNIVSYLLKCIVVKPKGMMRNWAAKSVRWMKRDAMWLYRPLKKIYDGRR